MKRQFFCVVSLTMFACVTSLVVTAQQSVIAPAVAASSTVPNLVNYTGVLKDANGKPVSGISGVTFLLYTDQECGAPLWIETQNVTPDKSGHYAVQLGATSASGLPDDLFVSGEARWLAVQVSGQAAHARVALVAVPYAMKAKDAETVGGLPPSAFVQAARGSAGAVSNRSAGRNAAPPGRITGVTAGTDLTGGGTSGNVTLNLDTTKVPQLNAANTFIGHQSVRGNITATGQVQGGPAGVLLNDGVGQTMQVFPNPSPTGAASGTVQFIPNAGTLVGIEAYSIGLISGIFGDFYCHHGLVAGGTGVCYFADVANNAGHVANSFSQSVQFDSVNSSGTDIFTNIRANPQNSLEVSSGISPGTSFGTIRQVPTVFANLPACGSTMEGTTATVIDSTVNTWGATVTGGGSNHILTYCDGAQWTVTAK
jgi:hypothetical protein